MANTFDRITMNPNVLAGRATIRGLRISVAHVVNLVANGMTPAQIVADLPELEEEDVRQALAYAIPFVGKADAVAGRRRHLTKDGRLSARDGPRARRHFGDGQECCK